LREEQKFDSSKI